VAAADVSVVIPCFRCAATVEQAVQSVLAQSAPARELILVDDASGDGTREALERLRASQPGRVTVITLRENGGPATARNAGWQAARGTWVAFLDADDRWHPRKLELQLGVMERRPELVLSGHRQVIDALLPEDADAADEVPCTDITLRSILLGSPFGTSSAVLRREMALRFEDGARYGEDYFLWLRIAASGGRVARLERVLGERRGPMFGGTGLSGALWPMERAELRSYRALRRQGAIGPLALAAASLWSLARFARRALVTGMRGKTA
jgi:glycosyltransferase involved in cell wall biosynthesis